MTELSDREKKIISYMTQSGRRENATRIGLKASKSASGKDGYKWAIKSLKNLVRLGYITCNCSGYYKIKKAHNFKAENNVDPDITLEKFITKHKGNNNSYTATR